ncbi:MAG: hypothetical protein A2049_00105 [Elusimicrobia bacterium GWA2_62_23]|nr:MAG: hypothetical protein A2049_00105 [Elusimicrobia bacterium GWA2_62_23]OGR70593.1 MAG: hypothetical protein A2179_02675 [Elusimicrobia bacterium GWC2_63_65]
MSVSKFWIRRDREQYLLGGIIITCAIGSFVSSYWHFSDRLNVRQNITIKKSLTPEAERKKLKELQYVAPKTGGGAGKYYKLDDTTIPSVPKLGEDDGE